MSSGIVVRMRPAFIALLALCLSTIGAGEIPTPKEIADTKAKAEQGDAKAQSKLADIFYYGEGVVIDITQSLKWASLSAA